MYANRELKLELGCGIRREIRIAGPLGVGGAADLGASVEEMSFVLCSRLHLHLDLYPVLRPSMMPR